MPHQCKANEHHLHELFHPFLAREAELRPTCHSHLPGSLPGGFIVIRLHGVAELHRGRLLPCASAVSVAQGHGATVLPQLSLQLVELLL